MLTKLLDLTLWLHNPRPKLALIVFYYSALLPQSSSLVKSSGIGKHAFILLYSSAPGSGKTFLLLHSLLSNWLTSQRAMAHVFIASHTLWQELLPSWSIFLQKWSMTGEVSKLSPQAASVIRRWQFHTLCNITVWKLALHFWRMVGN